MLPKSPGSRKANLPPLPEVAKRRGTITTPSPPFDFTSVIRKLPQGWRRRCPKEDHLKPSVTTEKLSLGLPQEDTPESLSMACRANSQNTT